MEDKKNVEVKDEAEKEKRETPEKEPCTLTDTAEHGGGDEPCDDGRAG